MLPNGMLKKNFADIIRLSAVTQTILTSAKRIVTLFFAKNSGNTSAAIKARQIKTSFLSGTRDELRSDYLSRTHIQSRARCMGSVECQKSCQPVFPWLQRGYRQPPNAIFAASPRPDCHAGFSSYCTFLPWIRSPNCC